MAFSYCGLLRKSSNDEALFMTTDVCEPLASWLTDWETERQTDWQTDITRVEEWKTNLMSLVILFYLLCAQYVSDINISIFRSLRLCWWITTSVVLFSVRCVLEFLQRLIFVGVRNISRSKNSNTQRTENKTTDVVIHQQSRRLLKMDILMSETCWAHNKWNKIKSDIKLVFHSSTIAMMHGPINIRFLTGVWPAPELSPLGSVDVLFCRFPS